MLVEVNNTPQSRNTESGFVSRPLGTQTPTCTTQHKEPILDKGASMDTSICPDLLQRNVLRSQEHSAVSTGAKRELSETEF